MENKFTKFTKHLLSVHIVIFIITLCYILSLKIIKDYFYIFDKRMPWQETFFNIPLKILLSIQVILYWSKFFLLFSAIVIIFYRLNLSRKFYIFLVATCIIYFAIEFNLIHNLFNFILQGYDFNAPTFNSNDYKFF